MGCSGMFFPAGNMHIGRTPGTVINSGASFFAADWALHSYFPVSSCPLLSSFLSSFLSSLASFSGALFLLSVT